MKTLDVDCEIAQQGIPQSWQATYRKALTGNRPAAVKTMCGMCQGWEDGARQAIRDCPSVGCPLHAVRPFQKKAGATFAEESEIDSGDETGSDKSFALKEVIKAAMRVASPSGELTEVKRKILDHLRERGESQRGYIIFSTGIPESLWNEAVRSLLTEGEIEREGEKRSTRYRLKD